jgi:hypothetical protein
MRGSYGGGAEERDLGGDGVLCTRMLPISSSSSEKIESEDKKRESFFVSGDSDPKVTNSVKS